MLFSSRAGSAALGLALTLALSLTAVAPAARAGTPDLGQQLRDLTQVALDSEFKACKSINGKLTKAIADPQFEQLSPDMRGVALYVAIFCAPEKSDQAVTAARRLVKLPVDPRLLYGGQLALIQDAYKREAPADYVAALDAIIEADPTLVADWKPEDVYWILRKVKDDPALEGVLLDHLHAVPWTHADARETDANGWAVRRARRLLEAGDAAKARAVLDGVTSTSQLLIVAQDRRFEPLWPQLQAEGRFDWIKLVQAELAAHQDRIKAEPTLLEPVTQALGDLWALERYDDAVALGDAYAARLRKGDIFTDAKEQRSWLLNQLAQVYYALGRFDAADALMVEATGEDPVSQAINRSEMLDGAGRPAEALKLLQAIDGKKASDYGQMWQISGQACVKFDLGDKAAADTLIAAMRPRWKDNADALGAALLCVGADDELAALYVRRLNDPIERAGVLAQFRNTRPARVEAPVYARREAHRRAIIARPEVVAALSHWGRPLDLPLSGNF